MVGVGRFKPYVDKGLLERLAFVWAAQLLEDGPLTRVGPGPSLSRRAPLFSVLSLFLTFPFSSMSASTVFLFLHLRPVIGGPDTPRSCLPLP